MNGYVRIRSWHVIKTWTRVPGRALTLCGRQVDTLVETPHGGEGHATAPGLPLGDKSCESCLRLAQQAPA